jgi:hypothetical protein
MELGRSGRTIDHAVGGAGELSEFQLRVIANARHRKISRFGSSLTRARGVQAELGGHVWTAGDELQHHGSRGFAPSPIKLPAGFAAAPELLAMDGELKATFCLLKDGQAVLS